MADFAHLHVHSHYSLLDGLGKIEPLIARARELEMDSLALTDHGVMYGAIEFVQTAQEHGIKPIVGVEAYLAPGGHTKKRGKIDANPRHLTLLAQNNTGYKNLVALTTAAHLHGYYYKPRIDYELLKAHSEGVIVLSGCLNSDISKAIVERRPADAERLIKWHLEVFGRDRFFLEVQSHASIPEQGQLNEEIFRYAKQFNLDVAATCDSHYIRPEDAEAQDVLLCVQTGKQVSDENRMNMLGEDYSLKSPTELKELWRDHPEVMDNTLKIAEQCNVEFKFGVNKLPPFPLPENTTTDQALRELCEKGLNQRYQELIPEGARERLDYELDVISKTGFASYFLIVSDFVNEAKRRGILVGPGRGSAAGSFVSYLTNITNLDPLAYNLLFERFLNPERVSMPDIDLDFADDRRGEVINYVRERYGAEHVAQIITFGTMAARAAVRDAGRALGFPYSFCDQIAKAVPPFMNFEQALETAELKELYQQDPQAKRLIDMARKLEGVCRHASTHAAAVVISDEPLTEYLPLQHSSTAEGENETVTQYAMYEVEALGLLKIDFLGLKNLTIIQRTLDRIKDRYGREIDLDTLPLDDSKAYELLQQGKTTGVFQLESSGMKRYLKELKPTEFEDIISMGALYRPGPMDSIPDFIAAKHGKKKITYLHPILKPILEKTYGVIVTQDQVLQIAREFAGFSYAEADILRKAVGKKIKRLLDEQREKFIAGAVNNKQIDTPTAKQVWDFIEPFARYGFNRAHAACYAMIAFQTAYLKAHFPAEFMAALLTSDEGNIDRAGIEVAEALSMGLHILPPSINESMESFSVVDLEEGDPPSPATAGGATAGRSAIRFGLGAVKNVGHNVVSAIITERKQSGEFKDLADVFARLESKYVNRKSIESLARAGAFDSLAERAQVLENMEKLLNFNRALHKKVDKGQQGLFGVSTAAPLPRLTLDPTSPASKEERLRWEKELLGMYVSEHPLSEFHEALDRVATPLAEASDAAAGAPIRIAGVINKIKKIMTKSQQPMLFVELEDLTGAAEALVFPSTLERTVDMWVDGASVIIEGKRSDKDGDLKILTDKVWPLSKETLGSLSSRQHTKTKTTPARAILIRLPRDLSKKQLQQLKDALTTHRAAEGLPVELLVPHNGEAARLKTEYILSAEDAALTAIRQLVGNQAVILRH